MSLLDRGSAWLDGKRVAHLSREVIYARPKLTESVTWLATVGSTQFYDSDQGGALVPSESRDYIGPADSLLFDGARSDPIKGDVITDTVGGRVLTCEVVAIAVNQPPFQFSDRYRRTVRVHTKVIADVPEA